MLSPSVIFPPQIDLAAKWEPVLGNDQKTDQKVSVWGEWFGDMMRHCCELMDRYGLEMKSGGEAERVMGILQQMVAESLQKRRPCSLEELASIRDKTLVSIRLILDLSPAGRDLLELSVELPPADYQPEGTREKITELFLLPQSDCVITDYITFIESTIFDECEKLGITQENRVKGIERLRLLIMEWVKPYKWARGNMVVRDLMNEIPVTLTQEEGGLRVLMNFPNFGNFPGFKLQYVITN